MAEEIKWIKICTGMFNNRKIQLIEDMPERDTIIVIWVKLLCLAGDINDAGVIRVTQELPYTDEMLATAFRRPIQTIRLALLTFQKFGMIDIIDDILHISNWAKYQNVEGMEKVKEQTRKRVAKHRQKKLLSNSNDCNVTCNATVTLCNAIDKNKNIDKELDIYINNEEEEEDINNNARTQLIDTFEVELKRPLTPIEMEFLINLRNDYSDDLITLALSEAVMNNARSFRYVERVLINWKGAGITTVDEAQQYIDKFNKRKSTSSNELAIMKQQYTIFADNPETLECASKLRMKYYDVTGRDIEDDIHD